MSDANDQPAKRGASWGVYVWAAGIALPAVAALALLGWRTDRRTPAQQRSDPEREQLLQANALPNEEEVSEPSEQAVPESVKVGVELFELAKAQEERRDYKEAEAVYGSAVRKLGGTSEAYEAAVAAAELNRLELRNPGRALKFYRQAKGLRPDGWHRERVLIGLGLTSQAMGDELEELRAWSELLAKFPNSDHAGEAERRLAQLHARRQKLQGPVSEPTPEESKSPAEPEGSAAPPDSF